MLSVIISVCLLSLLMLNHSHARAQSFNPQSHEIFNLLEKLYPDLLSSSPQATYLYEPKPGEEFDYQRDKDGKFTVFSRSYKEFDIRTDQHNLYLYYQDNLEHIGSLDFWLPYVKFDLLLNWFEGNFPSICSPQPQETKFEGEIYYRDYNDTNVLIGTYNYDLFFYDIDTYLADNYPTIFNKNDKLYNLGKLDSWTQKCVMQDYQEALGGIYTIQQKSNDRYLDAYVWSSSDYSAVTREKQNDDSQIWIVKPDTKDMIFYKIEYFFNKAEYQIDTVELKKRICGPYPDGGQYEFNIEKKVEESSYFEHKMGINISATISHKITVSIPKLNIGSESSIIISTSLEKERIYGKEEVKTKELSETFTMNIPANKKYEVIALVKKGTLNVPYAIFWKSRKTGAIHTSEGTWKGESFLGSESIEVEMREIIDK